MAVATLRIKYVMNMCDAQEQRLPAAPSALFVPAEEGWYVVCSDQGVYDQLRRGTNVTEEYPMGDLPVGLIGGSCDDIPALKASLLLSGFKAEEVNRPPWS